MFYKIIYQINYLSIFNKKAQRVMNISKESIIS